MWAPTARPNSPTLIPCFGLLIRSSGMAARAKVGFRVAGGGMMLRIGYVALMVVCAASAISVSSAAGASHVLITEDEARLPPPKGAITADRRGITRGPKIEVIVDGQLVHSPVHLQLKFESFGGAKIDPDSIKVTYMKTPTVDLTDRIKSFVQASGMDMPDAV